MHENWKIYPIYCPNCGALLYGCKNGEDKIKYKCEYCGATVVRVQKSRRHDAIDLFAPDGQENYETVPK